ncbi:MAG: hypothetical protein HKN51_16075 [Saprospiraceae bacterium]|nr:hypothetical protein [Saprospiraceae bacterium]
MNTKIVIGIMAFCLIQTCLFSQCDTGSEPECECETADILCSINELDGYSFSMSDYQHPEDGPDPLCGGSWVPNNPTWFSFIAWCEELEITVEISNCSFTGSTGAQVGVYSDCTSFTEVECIGDDCGNEDDKVLDLDGLIIGEIYHFMIDGCLGSACDVVISVDGMCTEEIEDWTDGIDGPTDACSGDVITYPTDDLSGATTYHWYIDGVEEATTSDPEYDVTWGAAGTYELCVDASNECVDEDEDPVEDCITVTVIEPDAGTITATPNPLCPGETSDVEVTGYNEDTGISEAIIVVDPNGEVIEVLTNGSTFPVTYDECGDVTVYSLNYADFEGLTIPAVGESYSGTDCVTLCCDETDLVISFEDDEDPEFVNPPGDVMLMCFDEVPPLEDLDATDNCAPDATVSPSETGTADLCDGGMLEREWMHTDDCGNQTIHVQVIVIDPIEAPEYINPPADIEIICSDMIPDPVDLMYTNGGVGGCLIDGAVVPVVTGMFDVCGSMITYEWDFTDMCGNILNHVQTINVLPAEVPEFINPPQDVIIDCDGTVPDAIDLEYTNGDVAPCLDEAFISPVVTGAFDACGTTIEYEWDYTDACGNNINHIQKIEIIPAIEPTFIDPPADLTLDCDAYNMYTFEDLDYTNSQTSPCEISGTVSPNIVDNTNTCGGTVEAEYEYEDDCGRSIIYVQTITVDPPPAADFTSMPADITVDCSDIPDPAEALMYSNGDAGICLIEGEADPIIDEDIDECGGTITNTWEFTDDCNRTIEYVQTITITPAPEAMFESLPTDMSLTCSEFEEFEPEILDYTNNESGVCLIEGEIDPSSSGDIDECGGVIIYLWEFTDNCGRTIEHDQTITVSPAPEAEFINVPSDEIIACEDPDDNLLFLEYDNEESGICQIQGFVEAIPSGVVDACGGMITMTWTYTDICGRTITDSQEVTYLPAEEPEFIDPPEDMIIDCDEDLPDADPLEYDNDEDEPCEINGEVDAVVTVDDNIYTYYWTFTNLCTDNTIEHTQIIEQRLPVEFEEDEFEVETCIGNEFDLSTILIIDENDTDPDITFHDDSPPDDSNEIDPIITLEDEEQEFFILGTNEFDCFDEAVVVIIAEEMALAGDDIEEEFCIGDELLDLYQYLEFPASFDGEFSQTDGPEDLDFAFADEINVSNAEPGIYTFLYYVTSENSCPDDEAEFVIELLEPIEIELISIACSPDGLTYTIVISNDNYDVNISDGVIISETPTEITIVDIPIDVDITLEVQNTSTRCEATFTFQHPDCSCPSVNAPEIVTNEQICEGEDLPTLQVTTDVDVIANWYDAPIGGTLLIANSLIYMPTNPQPGIYTFYIEGESTIQAGCFSAVRTPIQLEIIPAPIVMDTIIDYCDINQTGFIEILQSELDAVVFNGISGLTSTYYINESDLNNQINPIIFPFTNSEINNQTLYFEVTNSANCSSTGAIEVIINALPTIMPLINHETCLGATDGFIDIEVFTPKPPHKLVYNGDTLNNNLIQNLSPGIYTIEAIDSIGCSNNVDITIEPGIEINFDNISITCEDNGTSTDASDDFYNIEFSVNSTAQNGGMFSLEQVPSGVTNNYEYGVLNTIQLDADETMLSFIATDLLLGCIIEQDIATLTSCSSDCEITFILLDYFCSDNNTPLDPSDDFYEFSIDADVVNGGSANTYNVFLDNILTYSFDYNNTHSFSIPAMNQAVNIRIEDSEITNCFTSDITDILAPCSNACLIETELLSVECNDNGTLADENDDLFSYTFQVSPTNASDSFSVVGVNGFFGYDEEVTFENNVIINGDISLEITDQLDVTCIVDLLISPPLPCSEPCTIEIQALEISDCDDNGTNLDPADDTFSVSFIIVATDGNVGNIEIMDNIGNAYGPFNYDQTINITGLPADGSDVTLTFTDTLNGTCFLEQVVSQNSCSAACEITATVIDIICSDNGTAASNDDDIYNVIILVEGVNNSVSGYTTDIGVAGNYDEELTINDLLISDGDFELTISDFDQVGCQTNLQIVAPSPCSEPCTIDFLYVDILDCEDNGTNTESDDDFYSVAFAVNPIAGQVSEFTILDNLGNTYGPFEYDTDIELGPFVADGSVITLTINDVTNGTCLLETSVSQESCSNACIIDAQIIEINCNDNSTQGTNDDDTYTVGLLVEGINTSGEYLIEEIGTSNMFGMNVILGPFNILDGDQTFTISDGFNNSCFTTIVATAPAPCSDPCNVALLNLEIGDCNDNGSGDSSEDDFYNISFEISGIEGNGNNFEIRDNDGNIYGPFDYDILNNLGPLSANGNEITFTLVDNLNGSCMLEFVSQSDPCSDCDRSINLDASTLILDCDITTSTLTIASDPDIVSIEWTGPSLIETGNSIDVSSPGTYIALATFIDGCTANANVQITIEDDTPIADAGADGVINCEIESFTLDASGSTFTNNTLVEWRNMNGEVISNEIMFTIEEGGTYSLTLIDLNTYCISNTDEVTVNVFDNTPSAVIFADPGNIFNCFIESINLSTEEEENVIYSWLINNQLTNELIVTITEVADVSLIALDTLSNCSTESTIVFNDLTAFPIIALNDIEKIGCNNEATCIEVNSLQSMTPYEYRWYNEAGELVQDGGNTFCTNIEGTYEIELTDTENGCVNSQDFEVESSIVPIASLPQSIELKIDDDFQLSPNINLTSSNIESIVWSGNPTLSCNDCPEPTILDFVDNDIIMLTVTSIDGCQVIVETRLLLLEDVIVPKVYIPNVFTPNISENFTIYASPEIDIIDNMYIYDRWGELIFTNINFVPNDESLGWDGYFNDKPVEQGVYVYMFVFKINGRETIEVGDITLLR